MWRALPLGLSLVGPAIAKSRIIGGLLECADDLLIWGFLGKVVNADRLMQSAVEMANH